MAAASTEIPTFKLVLGERFICLLTLNRVLIVACQIKQTRAQITGLKNATSLWRFVSFVDRISHLIGQLVMVVPERLLSSR